MPELSPQEFRSILGLGVLGLIFVVIVFRGALNLPPVLTAPLALGCAFIAVWAIGDAFRPENRYSGDSWAVAFGFAAFAVGLAAATGWSIWQDRQDDGPPDR